jgi:hypothetical protein
VPKTKTFETVEREARRVVAFWTREWPDVAALPQATAKEWKALRAAVRRNADLVPYPIRGRAFNGRAPEFATVMALYERVRPTPANIWRCLPDEERALRVLAGEAPPAPTR